MAATDHICTRCKKSFVIKFQATLRQRTPKFCSLECYHLSRRTSTQAKYIGEEHVRIAERVLGHKLPSGVQVHHVDRNGRNNAHSNLVICQDQMYHRLLHHRQRVVEAGGNPNTEKVCHQCKTVKPKYEFSRSSSTGDGLQGNCKSCAAVNQAIYTAKRSAGAA